MDWIKLKEAAEITGRPERTLRHYAAEGRIEVKKEGRFWLVKYDSLKKLGLKKREMVVSPTCPVSNNKKTFSSSEKQKRQGVLDLGVYSELFGFYQKLPPKTPTSIYLREALDQLALGYYEFHIPKKLDSFRLARSALVKGLVVFLLENDRPSATKLEHSLIPGTSGLIRRLEKMWERTRASR